ncbi:hypothetical protein D3C80_1880300 [compost metagenome]
MIHVFSFTLEWIDTDAIIGNSDKFVLDAELWCVLNAVDNRGVVNIELQCTNNVSVQLDINIADTHVIHLLNVLTHLS